jgi:hypothetical protein
VRPNDGSSRWFGAGAWLLHVGGLGWPMSHGHSIAAAWRWVRVVLVGALQAVQGPVQAQAGLDKVPKMIYDLCNNKSYNREI